MPQNFKIQSEGVVLPALPGQEDYCWWKRGQQLEGRNGPLTRWLFLDVSECNPAVGWEWMMYTSKTEYLSVKGLTAPTSHVYLHCLSTADILG